MKKQALSGSILSGNQQWSIQTLIGLKIMGKKKIKTTVDTVSDQ